MTVQSTIYVKLSQALQPTHLDVLNESDQHNVPPGSESHFKVTVVSPHFVGEPLLARHRAVNRILAPELAGPVHALSLHTLTPEEWNAQQHRVPASPQCLGGKASEATILPA